MKKLPSLLVRLGDLDSEPEHNPAYPPQRVANPPFPPIDAFARVPEGDEVALVPVIPPKLPSG